MGWWTRDRSSATHGRKRGEPCAHRETCHAPLGYRAWLVGALVLDVVATSAACWRMARQDNGPYWSAQAAAGLLVGAVTVVALCGVGTAVRPGAVVLSRLWTRRTIAAAEVVSITPAGYDYWPWARARRVAAEPLARGAVWWPRCRFHTPWHHWWWTGEGVLLELAGGASVMLASDNAAHLLWVLRCAGFADRDGDGDARPDDRS